MHGTYTTNQKFDSIRILVICDTKKISENGNYIKDVIKIYLFILRLAKLPLKIRQSDCRASNETTFLFTIPFSKATSGKGHPLASDHACAGQEPSRCIL